MRVFLILVIGLSMSVKMYAQIGNVNDVSGTLYKLNKEDNIQGSEYLFDGAWSYGKIKDKSNREIEDVRIRYNSFKDHLELLKGDGTIIKVDMYSVDGFSYERVSPEGDIYKYKFENVRESLKDAKYNLNYLRIIYDDKFKLYMDHKVIMQKVTPPSYGAAKITKYIPQEFLLLFLNDEVLKLKPNKRSFIKAFPNLKSEIKKYVREYEIDYENDTDLIMLCDFISSELS